MAKIVKKVNLSVHSFFASGDQGALFEKTAPWTPVKTFD